MPIKIFVECSKVDDNESVEDLEKQYNNWERELIKNSYIETTDLKIETTELKLINVEGYDVPNKYLIVRYSYGNKISE